MPRWPALKGVRKGCLISMVSDRAWIGWGRRPVAVRNRYIDEMAELRPGTLRTVDELDLAPALRAALDRPESTWHGLTQLPMSWPEVAESYVRWWEGLYR